MRSPEGRPATSARAVAGRVTRARVKRRRVAVVIVLALVVALGVVGARIAEGGGGTVLTLARGRTIRIPDDPTLSPLRRRIVALAESQLGYTTDPADTYCNRFSAYWKSGANDCGNANLDEQWCADFAAWVWRKAGVPVVYQYVNGDLNSSSASFYEWGVAHDTWHPLGSGYTPEPGDVAVYGLDVATLLAAHVAIVVADLPGERGPVAINGDGDQTGFSVVEAQADEYEADTDPTGAPLSGYVSPT